MRLLILLSISCATPQRQPWTNAIEGTQEDAFLMDEDFGCLSEVRNAFGTCIGCHERAESRFDLVCASDHGCKPLPKLALKMAAKATAADPRCPSP